MCTFFFYNTDTVLIINIRINNDAINNKCLSQYRCTQYSISRYSISEEGIKKTGAKLGTHHFVNGSAVVQWPKLRTLDYENPARIMYAMSNFGQGFSLSITTVHSAV